MPPLNPSQQILDAPLNDLIIILFKQFKGLLAHHDIELTNDEVHEIAQIVIEQTTLSSKALLIRTALVQMIEESIHLLHTRWGYTFARSLASNASELDNWETTAEFLEVANEKSNAELRISMGSALVVMLGDASFASYLIDVIEFDEGMNDADALFARRGLCQAAGVKPHSVDWLAQIRNWLQHHT